MFGAGGPGTGGVGVDRGLALCGPMSISFDAAALRAAAAAAEARGRSDEAAEWAEKADFADPGPPAG